MIAWIQREYLSRASSILISDMRPVSALNLSCECSTLAFPDSHIQEDEMMQFDQSIPALKVVCEQEAQRIQLRYCNLLGIC
jgi:hypothetical protein